LKHEASFLALGALKLTETLLEFSICHLDDGEKIVDVRPGVVGAFVPALGAPLQGFVVPILVLLDETL